MKQKDIDAIHHGIAKYDRLAHGFPEGIYDKSCKLCWMYVDNDCEGCIINKKTDGHSCDSTPWERIYLAHLTNNQFSNDATWCRAVEDEIEFLISLLPEEEQRRYDLGEI